jgi:hypothetical protein
MDLVLFPTDNYYYYLREYLKNIVFENPIYFGYDFDNCEKCEKCDIDYVTYDTEQKLKTALEFLKKFSAENKETKIKVYLFTPNISYYHEKINISEYLEPNIIEFNYLVKECERMWTRDFDEQWLNDKRVKYIAL